MTSGSLLSLHYVEKESANVYVHNILIHTLVSPMYCNPFFLHYYVISTFNALHKVKLLPVVVLRFALTLFDASRRLPRETNNFCFTFLLFLTSHVLSHGLLTRRIKNNELSYLDDVKGWTECGILSTALVTKLCREKQVKIIPLKKSSPSKLLYSGWQ